MKKLFLFSCLSLLTVVATVDALTVPPTINGNGDVLLMPSTQISQGLHEVGPSAQHPSGYAVIFAIPPVTQDVNGNWPTRIEFWCKSYSVFRYAWENLDPNNQVQPSPYLQFRNHFYIRGSDGQPRELTGAPKFSFPPYYWMGGSGTITLGEELLDYFDGTYGWGLDEWSVTCPSSGGCALPGGTPSIQGIWGVNWSQLSVQEKRAFTDGAVFMYKPDDGWASWPVPNVSWETNHLWWNDSGCINNGTWFEISLTY